MVQFMFYKDNFGFTMEKLILRSKNRKRKEHRQKIMVIGTRIKRVNNMRNGWIWMNLW